MKRHNFRIELSNLYKIILFFFFCFLENLYIVFFSLLPCVWFFLCSELYSSHKFFFVSLSLASFFFVPVQCVRTCVWQAVRLKIKNLNLDELIYKKDFHLHTSLIIIKAIRKKSEEWIYRTTIRHAKIIFLMERLISICDR
jgi:hypothetical protein